MRFVDRSKARAPAALTKADGKGAEELAAARDYRVAKQQADAAGTPLKAFGFKVYKDDAVKAALAAMFHGKCAYCETYYSAQAPVDVEHFRPKGAVEGEKDHPGYWWLGMAWSNLLPSCIDCNRRRRQETPKPSASLGDLHRAGTRRTNTGKKDVFPVAGPRAALETDNLDLEKAHLIDPSREDPDEHLEYHIDPAHLIGLILPKRLTADAPALPAIGDATDIAAAAEAAGVSVRGAVSIQVYGLNRLGLVQERTRVLRHLEFLRQLILDIDAVARKLQASADPDIRAASATLDQLIDRVIAEIAAMAEPTAPYSALVAHWKRRFLAELKT